MKEKQPFYKRWWFILIAAVVVLGISNIINSNEQSTSDKPKTEQVSKKPKQEQKAEKKKDEPKEKVIELKEEIPFVDFTAKIQRVKIKDDRLTIVLDWTNQSDWNPAHFSLLAGIDVYQNDEILEMTKGEDRLLKRIKKDSFDVVDLEYKLEDNKTPIKITFIPWNEYDEKKELTIEIN